MSTKIADVQLDHTVGAVKATKKQEVDSKAKHEMESKALNDRGGAVDLLKHQPVNKQLTMVNEEVERESEVSEKRQRTPADSN